MTEKLTLAERKTEVMKEMNIRTYDELVCAEPPEPSAFVGNVVWVRKWQWNLLLKRLKELEAPIKQIEVEEAQRKELAKRLRQVLDTAHWDAYEITVPKNETLKAVQELRNVIEELEVNPTKEGV